VAIQVKKNTSKINNKKIRKIQNKQNIDKWYFLYKVMFFQRNKSYAGNDDTPSGWAGGWGRACLFHVGVTIMLSQHTNDMTATKSTKFQKVPFKKEKLNDPFQKVAFTRKKEKFSPVHKSSQAIKKIV
jgi:hypothetical protein